MNFFGKGSNWRNPQDPKASRRTSPKHSRHQDTVGFTAACRCIYQSIASIDKPAPCHILKGKWSPPQRLEKRNARFKNLTFIAL